MSYILNDNLKRLVAANVLLPFPHAGLRHIYKKNNTQCVKEKKSMSIVGGCKSFFEEGVIYFRENPIFPSTTKLDNKDHPTVETEQI
jgi:hypothetical protein